MSSVVLPYKPELPMCFLSKIIYEKKTAIIFLRNNKKIIGKMKAFDRHFNLVLENVREIWNESKFKEKITFRERHIGKMILRGDSIIIIIPLNLPEAS